MAIFTWHSGSVSEGIPEGMEIRQVYGILFFGDGRILLKGENDRYSLVGGHPEHCDGGIGETLRREVLEEVNLTIGTPVYVGFQEVDDEDGSPRYAQVRMAAMIDQIGFARPDTDNGKQYDRLLVSPKRAIELLQWGEVGRAQIMDAVDIAVKMFGIGEFSQDEVYI